MKTLAAHALRLADPYQAVSAVWARQPPQGALRVLAIGKAAAAMWHAVADCAAASAAVTVRAALIIAPEPATVEPSVACSAEWLVAAHPVPDVRSLQAGERALAFVAATAADETLLVLLSGGASSLCEALPADFTLAELQALQTELLASDLPIEAINAIRQQLSRIKGGGLLAACPPHATVRQWLISDVPGDDLRVIGSAPFVSVRLPAPDWPRLPAHWRARLQSRWQAAAPLASTRVHSELVCSNRSVRTALQQQAEAMALPVQANRAYHGNGVEVAAQLADCMQRGPAGLYLFGGECHLQLPENPGRGGRNQQLALLLQQRLSLPPGLSVLCLASDGVDGQSDAAGALFQSAASGQAGATSVSMPAISAALATASSYDYWSQYGGLLFTGATGANVADLVIGWKSPVIC